MWLPIAPLYNKKNFTKFFENVTEILDLPRKCGIYELSLKNDKNDEIQ